MPRRETPAPRTLFPRACATRGMAAALAVAVALSRRFLRPIAFVGALEPVGATRASRTMLAAAASDTRERDPLIASRDDITTCLEAFSATFNRLASAWAARVGSSCTSRGRWRFPGRALDAFAFPLRILGSIPADIAVFGVFVRGTGVSNGRKGCGSAAGLEQEGLGLSTSRSWRGRVCCTP